MNAIAPRLRGFLAAGLLCSTLQAAGATPPFVQLIAAPLAPRTCDSTGAAPAIAAHVDLGEGGSYRYSPAFVIPYFFDDEGEFNLVWNQDVTLFVSGFLGVEDPRPVVALPIEPLAVWYAGFARVPEQTELALRVATYDASGRTVATSRISWNCTTGVIRAVEHRGNAAGPVAFAGRLVEFFHAGLDHYFVSADPGEIAALDAGLHAGWRRTDQELGVYARPVEGFSGVCRFYLPPPFGDSHFYSVSASECADVRARFPGFVEESAAAFAVAPADQAGKCPAGTLPVYRLWNARTDSNHRYTADPAIRDAMLAKGYVAEGYGPDAVAFCALP